MLQVKVAVNQAAIDEKGSSSLEQRLRWITGLKASDAGMDDYIVKAFDAASLVRSILRHVRPTDTAAAGAGVPNSGAPPAVIWQQIEDIDADDAQQRFGGDFVLFLSLLRRVLAEFADVMLAAPDAASPVDLALRGARMHKLRGIAGMLGAKAIQRDAGDAEQACAAGDGDGAMQLGASLDARLRRLGEQAAAPLTAAAAVTADAVVHAQRSNSGPREPHMLRDLIALLRTQSLSAMDHFRAATPQLRHQLSPQRFDSLQALIDNLQFSDAADLLAQHHVVPA